MAGEILTFTRANGTGTSLVTCEHRAADISGFPGDYTGNMWVNFTARRGDPVRKVNIPGLRGVDAKDFAGDVVVYTVFGFVISAGVTRSLTNRYDGLQTQRDEIFRMVSRKSVYNLAGPIVESATGGACLIQNPNFGLIDDGGHQPFDLEVVVLAGK